MARRLLSAETSWLFGGMFVALAAVTVWLLMHDYSNGFVAERWAKVMSVMEGPEMRLEYFGLFYPHAPVYALLPFYFIPGLDSPQAPFILSVAAGAGLLTLWFRHLGLKRYSMPFRLGMVCLAATHPFFLWSVTSGTEKALSLFVFYFLCLACVRMDHKRDVRAIIMLGCALGLYFFVDERAVFIALGMALLLPLVAPPQMLRESITGVYTVAVLPFLIAVLAWIYMNWIFEGDPWQFVTSRESAFAGAKYFFDGRDWLGSFGGRWFAPLFLAIGAGVAAYPALLWPVVRAFHRRILLGSVAVFVLLPALAVAFASVAFFIDHPMQMVFLYSAAFMAALILVPKLTPVQRRVVAMVMVMGNIGAWALFGKQPDQDMNNWMRALQGHAVPVEQADARLGAWLAEHPLPTLMDDRTTYRAIIARGDARNLVLPFMREFKLALKERIPRIDQVVVMAPGHPQGHRDRVTLRYPELYEEGMTGYVLAYDHDRWRVYRKQVS